MTRYEMIDDDIDYLIEGRDSEPNGNRMRMAQSFSLTSKQKYSTNSRHKRNGGRAELNNGIHRRGQRSGMQ